jgi:hypothetical protein
MTTLARPWTRSLALTGVGLAVALALPFLVHLLPVSGAPAGARLLPIFYAGLLLLLRGAPLPAIAVAFVAPHLNAALTGMPAGLMLPTLAVELPAFTAAMLVALRLAPGAARFLAPVAYLLATLLARTLVWPDAPAPAAILAAAVSVSWPGLLALLAIGALAPRRPA